MSTWILQGQLSEKTFQGLLGDPNQDRFGKLKATWAAAGVTLVDAYMNPCGYFFAFLDGSSENVHACVMMFRALGVWSDTKLDVVNHFRDLNKFFQKSSEIVSYYDAPWAELDKQKRLAEEAKDEIRSSIRYASQIQQAMLPSSFPSDLEIGVHWQPLNVVEEIFTWFVTWATNYSWLLLIAQVMESPGRSWLCLPTRFLNRRS